MSGELSTPFVVCLCGRAVGLLVQDGVPVSWHVVSLEDVESQARRAETEGEVVYDDHIMAGVMAFTTIIACECGRRYKALDYPPWIQEEGGGGADAPVEETVGLHRIIQYAQEGVAWADLPDAIRRWFINGYDPDTLRGLRETTDIDVRYPRDVYERYLQVLGP